MNKFDAKKIDSIKPRKIKPGPLGLNHRNQISWYETLSLISQGRQSCAAAALSRAYQAASDEQKKVFDKLIAKNHLGRLFNREGGKLKTNDETKKAGMRQAAKAVLVRTSGKSLSKTD